MKYISGSITGPSSCRKHRSAHKTAPSVILGFAVVSASTQSPSNFHCAVRLRMEAVITAASEEVLERSMPERRSGNGVCKKEVCRSERVRVPLSDRCQSFVASRRKPLLFSDIVTLRLVTATGLDL